jgi:hypothetical protein
MLKVGLTGGIGCGKTTVANLFAEKGVPVIDADQISRQLVEPDRPVFWAIVRHFGEDVLLDGQLNRRILKERIFCDPMRGSCWKIFCILSSIKKYRVKWRAFQPRIVCWSCHCCWKPDGEIWSIVCWWWIVRPKFSASASGSGMDSTIKPLTLFWPHS